VGIAEFDKIQQIRGKQVNIYVPDSMVQLLANFLRDHDPDTFYGIISQLEATDEDDEDV
jgi:hypothetical protein